MTRVDITQALDAQGQRLEHSYVTVSRHCKDAYEMELGLTKLLQVMARRWAPKPKTFAQKANVFRTLRQWWLRIGAAIEVMRNVQAINERTKGFEWAKRHAIQSAVLFGCPRFMQGFMSRRFLVRAKRRQSKEELQDHATFEELTDAEQAETV